MTLNIHPLTPETWPALEDLFGRAGGSNGCWCMYWRLGPGYRERPRTDNKRDLRDLAASDARQGCSRSTGPSRSGGASSPPELTCHGWHTHAISGPSTTCQSGQSHACTCAARTVTRA
jgi:hypothetical protein